MPATQEQELIDFGKSFISEPESPQVQTESNISELIEVGNSFLKDEPIEKSLEVRLQERRAIQQTASDQLFQDARETEINTDTITTQPLKRHNQIRREHNLPPAKELPEELLGGRTINNLKNAISEFANFANRGVEGIADAVSALNELAGLPTFEESTGIPFGIKNVNEFFEASRNVIKAYLPDDPRLRDEYLTQLSRGVGGAASFVAAGVAGGPALLAGLALGSGAQEQAEAARASNADETTKAVATVLGVGLGATDIIPGARYVRALKPVNRVLNGRFFDAILNKGGVLVDVVTEGLQEFGQEAGSNIIAKRILEQDKDLFEGTFEAGSVGVGVGGIFGTITRLLGKIAGIKIKVPKVAVKPTETRGQLFAKEKPEAAQRLRKSAVVAQKENGKQGIPSKQDFAAEGLPDLSRKERAAFVKELSEAEEVPPVKAVKTEQTPKKKPAVEEKVDREKLKEGARRRQANFDPKNVILPPPGDVVGFVDMDDVASAVKKGTSATKAFLQKYFTSRGDFPDAVFQRKIARDGNISRLINQARFTLRDFDRAAREVYGGRKKMTPMDVARVDAVLKDEVDASTIPIEMREVVTRMRAEIDALSQALIDVGAIEGPLVARILENKGVYATRSYRIFTDPKWAQSVPLEIRNIAKDYLRRDNPKLTEDQAEARIKRLLVIGQESDSPFALLKKGKLGSKDLSILKKRGDIPIEIRLLWGEHADARVNYSQSILKMAHLLENHKFLTDVAENGLGVFFFEEPTIVSDQKFVTKIDADGSDALAPLNGLYTTIEIKKAFEDAGDTASYGAALRTYFKVNAGVKYSKTVLSLMTHIRNVIGNTGFAIAQGHFKVWNFKKAVRTTLASVGVMDTKEYREFFLKMVELKVVDESARAKELQDAIKDMSKLDADQFLGANADKLATRISRTATEAYRAEDDVWKIFAFLHEESRYKKARPDWTQDQVDRKAAEIVRNTYPTYSLIPAIGRILRRIPVGTFTSFPLEVHRIGFKTFQLINEERKDPRTRGIAAVRMAGVMAATSIVPAITAFSMFINGLDDDDDEAYRQFMPPWSENSSILYLGKDENGDMEYIDLSYVDVYQYFRKPAIALMRGGNWKESVIDAGVQASEPFLSPEIFAGKLIDVSVNRKNSTSKSPGGQIRNPADDLIKQGTDTLIHLYKAIEPGTFTSARRISKGLTGEVSVYGKTYDPVTESLAVLTGQRRSKVNIPQSLFFKVREIGSDLNNVSRIIGNVVRRRGTVTEDEIKEAVNSYEKARKKTIEHANLIYTSAIRRGVSTKDVKAEFRSRFSKEKMQEITTGVPQKNSWASDLIYLSTNKLTSKETAKRNFAAIKKFGLNRVQAERLLLREYKWRTLRKGDVPKRGTPRTDAYARRVRILRKSF